MATTRRGLLKAGIGAGLGSTLLVGSQAQPAQAGLLGPLGTAWVPNPLPLLQRFSATDPGEVTLHATLLKAEGRIPNPINRWYLWVWTHDAPIMRLYTNSEPTGQFTEYGQCFIQGRPGRPWDSGHFAAGDVVWDPVNRCFYSCPHTRLADDPTRQSTFIMRSDNGFHWQVLGNTPIINYNLGYFDSRSATYPRFMRDVYGNLARHNGQVAIFYRGQEATVLNDQEDNSQYRMGAVFASTPQAVNWTRANGGNPLFNPLLGNIFAIGCAIYQAGHVHVTITVGGVVYQKKSPVAGNPFAQWSNDGPGVPMYAHAQLIYDGASVVQEGDTQYAVTAGVLGVPGGHNKQLDLDFPGVVGRWGVYGAQSAASI